MHERTSDVLVIGGGPAGSTIASYLCMKGYDVTVLERERFPREHVGESLLPFCYHLFKELGVLDEIERRFVRKPGVRFIDVDGTTSTAWCFAHHITDESNLSFHVIRAEFDKVLLDHSAALGATVHQQTRVTDVRLGDELSHVTAVGPDGEQRHTTRFVVDASGRDTFLSNRLGTKTAHKDLERTAIGSNYWKGGRYQDTLEEGVVQIIYLGGDKQGWIWVIPLGTDRLSAGVVVNTSYYLEQRRVLREQGVDDWKMALYLQEMFSAPFTRQILEDAHMERPLMVNGDYSYVCHRKWGPNFALVGDASAFIDPIFSTGVYMAMESARLAADAVDVRLSEGEEAGDQAFKVAYESIVGAYDLIDKLIRLFYTPDAINFAQLGSASEAFSDFDHYKNAMAVYHFLIAGDFFERSAEYSGFVDSLRDTKMFRRYKRYVLDRPSLNAPTCEVPREVAFHAGLSEHEPRRELEGI